MNGPERTLDEIGQAIDEVLKGLGTCNVLIAGRTGVGKSTLINSVFHGDMATTGHGTPVTKNARLIRKEGVPLGIWDTRGLEMADFRETLDELTQLVEERARHPYDMATISHIDHIR
ncbi:MAG: 50S ribosome-binding GTPase [Gemmatimonadetes bacterium]|nr:50S ribosome-binding GTPase [Gemmatimonadota bacterium]